MRTSIGLCSNNWRDLDPGSYTPAQTTIKLYPTTWQSWRRKTITLTKPAASAQHQASPAVPSMPYNMIWIVWTASKAFYGRKASSGSIDASKSQACQPGSFSKPLIIFRSTENDYKRFSRPWRTSTAGKGIYMLTIGTNRCLRAESKILEAVEHRVRLF